MPIKTPSDAYAFEQLILGDGVNRNQYTIQSKGGRSGNYSVGGKSIIANYNSSTHWRSGDELNRMGIINETFQKKLKREFNKIIKDTEDNFLAGAPPMVKSMWDDVIAAYKSAFRAA